MRALISVWRTNCGWVWDLLSSGAVSAAINACWSESSFKAASSLARAKASSLIFGVSLASVWRASAMGFCNLSSASLILAAICSTSPRTLSGWRERVLRATISLTIARKGGLLGMTPISEVTASTSFWTVSSVRCRRVSWAGAMQTRVATHAQSREAEVRAPVVRTSQRSTTLRAVSPSINSWRLWPVSRMRRHWSSWARRAVVFSGPSPRASACIVWMATVVRRKSLTNGLSATARTSSKSAWPLKISAAATQRPVIRALRCSGVSFSSF